MADESNIIGGEGKSTDRPKYHHDADHGETRFPPESGEEHSGVRDERDVHSPLNRPSAAGEDAPRH